jgi:mRNA-degrading endonuclease toxin of MazEF toxin-antitoxin module
MTSESKTFDRWDVVVALFPFTDIEVRKPRPVLVLSDRAFNQTHGHFIAAMITTGVDSQWPSDCRIEDLAACGLKHASLVRLKLFTLPLAVAPRRIGRLGAVDLNAVGPALAQVLPTGPHPP